MKNIFTKSAMLMAIVVAFSFSARAASDGGVATILRTANDLEIDAAQMAKKKASNEQVKAFAQTMIDGHKENNKETATLVKKLNIKTEPTEEAATLKKDEAAKMKSWKNVSGAEFDKAYIANQIEMHKSLISKLDSDFIPNARNAEFKAHLEKTRNHVQEHLTKAEEIQTSL